MIVKSYRNGFTAEDLRTLLWELTMMGQITDDRRLLIQHTITFVAKSGWSTWNNTMIEIKDKWMNTVILVKSGSCSNHMIVHFDGNDRPVDYYERKSWGFWLYGKVVAVWNWFAPKALSIGGTAAQAAIAY